MSEKNILLAEDDNDDVLIFELALKQLTTIAIKLRHAEDGEKLFELLKEYIPDILFLDINMPCKDGLSCIVEIRKNRDYDNLPVIMYTSYLPEDYVEAAFRGGANFYLVKQNTINDLVEKLRKIFEIDWKTFMHYPPKDQFLLNSEKVRDN